MADNDSVGKISVDITGNEKPLQKKVESLGEKLKAPMSKLGAAMAAAFSTALISKFAKESIESAAQVNAANSQMSQTFGELEDKARSVMSTVAKNSGIMETRLQEVGTSIYAFAKTSGMDSASAMSMMQDALQATADSAAYYDRSLEETAESLKSFLKGNYANDAALGISCTETTRNAAANKLYGKSFKDLSEAQKQLTLLQMVKDANKLSGAMGQAAREADGWENVTGNLKEAWKQFQAVVGQPALKAATAVVKKLTEALQQLTAYAKTAAQALSKLFGWDISDMVTDTGKAADKINNLTENADNGTESLKKTAKAAEKLKKTVAGFDQLNILSSEDSEDEDSAESSTADNSGEALSVPDISTAGKSADDLGKKLDGLKNKIRALYEDSGLKGFADSFKSQFDKIDFKQIGKNFKSIFTDLQPIAQASLGGIQKITASKLNYLGTLFGGFVRTAGNHIQTLSGGIAQWLNKDKGKISSFITDISGNISNGIDNCTSFIGTLFDTYNESLERMRPDTEEAISTLLSGFTNFAGSVGEVLSGAFEIVTGSAAAWAEDNKGIIGEAFDGVQDTINQITSGIGQAFDDIGQQLSSWWNDSGAQETFSQLCSIFGDVGTAALNLYNGSIKPAIDNILSKLGTMWQNFSPIIGNVLKLLKSLGDMIMYLWTEHIKPVLDIVVENVTPIVMGVVDVVVGAVQGLWDAICGIVNGLIEIITGIIDFLTGVFTGDWEKAWSGVCEFFTGIWDAVVGAVTGVCEAIANIFKGLLEAILGVLQILWGVLVNILSKIWEKVCEVFSAIGNFLKSVWDGIVNVFKGIGQWFGDRFKEAWDGIKNIWNRAGQFFQNIWKAIKKAFSETKKWLVDQFTNAWNSVVGLFQKGGEIFGGIRDSLGGVFKDVINGLVDSLNWVISKPVEGLNDILSAIKNVDILGAKPFSWVNTIPVPQIPKLAKGGLVKAPTLAMVGDNKGAAHDPEVVSPLSKLESMMHSNDPEIIRLLTRIAALLEHDESIYQNNIYLDSEVIERKLVKVRRRKQRRYGGAVTT